MLPSIPEREVKKEMSMLNELKALGADVDGTLENLNGKQSLYERLIFKFLKMMREKDVPLDFDETDYSEITDRVHMIKGGAGNLGIAPIYEGYNEALRLLRAGDPAQAKLILRQLVPVKQAILDCISRYVP